MRQPRRIRRSRPRPIRLRGATNPALAYTTVDFLRDVFTPGASPWPALIGGEGAGPDCDDLFADPDAVHPDIYWWQGPTGCSICGWNGRSVIPIGREHDAPIVPMECPGCRNMTLNPIEGGEQ